jgi:hypothetical protein
VNQAGFEDGTAVGEVVSQAERSHRKQQGAKNP